MAVAAVVWDLWTGQQRATLAGHTMPVRAVARTQVDGVPIGHHRRRRRLRWWRSVRVGSPHATCTAHACLPYPVTALTYDPNNKIIVGAAHEVIVIDHRERSRGVGVPGTDQDGQRCVAIRAA
jgi:hypothetical protein